MNEEGCDISQYQTSVPKWADFVIIRISSGDGGLHRDSRAESHIKECRKRKVPFAVYHYTGHEGGVKEARFAVEQMKALGVWGHKLVCDAEGTSTLPDVQDFIKEAKVLLKPSNWLFRKRLRVGLYSGGWIKANGGGRLGAQFGWIAHWGVDHPTLPAHWDADFTRLWQHTAAQGIDKDRFLGKSVDKFFGEIDRRGFRV
jgi:GH25 family lysozyme M1 (1,4-beta-N-acetylmuramidase)